jgi:hypothetical protein
LGVAGGHAPLYRLSACLQSIEGRLVFDPWSQFFPPMLSTHIRVVSFE